MWFITNRFPREDSSDGFHKSSAAVERDSAVKEWRQACERSPTAWHLPSDHVNADSDSIRGIEAFRADAVEADSTKRTRSEGRSECLQSRTNRLQQIQVLSASGRPPAPTQPKTTKITPEPHPPPPPPPPTHPSPPHTPPPLAVAVEVRPSKSWGRCCRRRRHLRAGSSGKSARLFKAVQRVGRRLGRLTFVGIFVPGLKSRDLARIRRDGRAGFFMKPRTQAASMRWISCHCVRRHSRASAGHDRSMPALLCSANGRRRPMQLWVGRRFSGGTLAAYPQTPNAI